MIIVYEPVCHGLMHVPYNAGLLESICIAYPDKKISFYGEESHLRFVRAQVEYRFSSTISWNNIELSSKQVGFMSRFVSDFKNLIHLFKVIKKENNKHIVISCVAPSTLSALKFIMGFINRNSVVQVVIHGHLESLTGWRSRNPFIRFIDFKSLLEFGNNKRIQYIILEESIRKKIISILPSLRQNVSVLEHPIAPNEQKLNRISFKPPYCFGFLGLVTEAKGFDIFNRVASKIIEKFQAQVEFHAIGHLSNNSPRFEMSSLKTQPGIARLSREDFILNLESLHYVCLPFKREHYELSPSGILLDAIAFCKPLIASRLPIFEDLFDQYGDIGHLFSNEAEFYEIIENIIKESDSIRYNNQVLALQELKKMRDPKALAYKYKSITSNLYSRCLS